MDGKFNDRISGRAPGYWGRDPHHRVISEDVLSKVTRWNMDKILTLGLPFAVWREASVVLNNTTTCSCFKDTAKQADIPCLSCYGTGKIPGYVKFGTRNYWAASTDAGWTLTNIELDKVNRPNRLHLNSTSTAGTAISPLIPIDVTGKLGNWETKFDGFTRDGGAASSITVQYAYDGGTAWYDLADINTHVPTTSVQFRVSITRNSTSVKSPMFEIIRVRFQDMPDIRGELNEPVIRVIPTWDKNAEYRTAHGIRTDSSGKRFWTMPLTYFNTTLLRDTVAARLADDVIAEVRYGGNIGFRFALTEFDYSDTFGSFSRQEFALRQFSGKPGELGGEFAYRIF